MNINIDSVHFDADKKLIEFIEKKMEKLNKKQNKILGADIKLKLDKATDTQNKIAEIKIKVPGEDFFAKKQSKSFEESVDTTISALEKQLARYKEKFKK
ncbi:MAG TPA: ribosome-associated translation inhibitor RaiA [Bacteroidales bacterium]|nr:ribosome-associated translation inhibitor RaiA [Bacteroidales bacterium]